MIRKIVMGLIAAGMMMAAVDAARLINPDPASAPSKDYRARAARR